MAELIFSHNVAAAPNEIFAFFVPQRMPLWYGSEMNARFEVQGGKSEFEAGQTVRVTGHLKGRAMSLVAIISAYQWERLLEWEFEDSYGVRGSQRWELTPVDGVSSASNPDGNRQQQPIAETSGASLVPGTRVSMRDSYRMPGFYGRIVDVILTRHAVALRDRSWLTRLDQLATRR